MFVEYLSRKRGSLKAWVGKLLMPVVTVMLLVGMTMAGNVQAASSCDVVKNGLVACYPFDGNANDGSGNGNHGTVNGATLTVDRFGKPNSAYLFDGINDYIRVNDDPSIRMDSSFTIVAWVKGDYIRNSIVAGITGDKNIGASWELGPQVSTSPTTEFGVRITPTTWIRAVDPIPLSSQEWIQLVGVWNQGTRTTALYHDGVKVLDVTGQVLTRYPHDDGLSIGAYLVRGAVQSTKGIIDDVSIYNRALTEEEIKKLYQLKDSPPKTCEHAIYSVTNNIGKLVIPFVEIPLLNLYTQQPTGELAVFSGELKQVGSSMDFGLVSSKLKLIFLTTAADPCHAVYDETQKTLHAPFVDVGNEVYDVKFQHLKDIPLELGVFHLESYDLVE